MEFFVSSKHSMNKSDLKESPIMVNKEIMDLLNADVDGDMAVLFLSMADAQIADMTPGQRKALNKAHADLIKFSHKIAAGMKRYANGGKAPAGQKVVDSASYAGFDSAETSRIIERLAGEASKKNFAAVGKYDNMRQALQNYNALNQRGIWQLGYGKKVGKKEGQIDPDQLFSSLVTSEFLTIFPQEGISAKKVAPKLLAKIKEQKKDFAKMSETEQDEFLTNFFYDSIYKRLTLEETYTEAGLDKLFKDLAAWGQIDLSTPKEKKMAASKARAGLIFALMGALTGQKSWTDPNRVLDDATIKREVLKFSNSLPDTIINGQRVKGLAGVLQNRHQYLPNSTVASLASLRRSGMSSLYMNLSPEAQKMIYQRLGLPDDFMAQATVMGQGDTAAQKAGVDQITNGNFNDAIYRALFASMAGFHSGTAVDLVDAAVAQTKALQKTPAYERPSKFGSFLRQSDVRSMQEDIGSQIAFWERLRNFDEANATKVERASLVKEYNTLYQHTNRGQIMNAAQLLARYGRYTQDGKEEILSLDKMLQALDSKDPVAELTSLGIDKASAQALVGGFTEKAPTEAELRKAAKRDLGATDQMTIKEIEDLARDQASLYGPKNAPTAEKANNILHMLTLMGQGGGPVQLIEAYKKIQRIQDEWGEGKEESGLQRLVKMTNVAAQTLKGYNVVGNEENLVGFWDKQLISGQDKNNIVALAGSSDLILQRADGRGGVRIADFKSKSHTPDGTDAQYIAQLMAYGYAYNQTRDKIRSNPNMTYKDFLEGDQGKLYTQMKGQTVSEGLFNVMKSDRGYLDEVALNYIDQWGNARVFAAKYDDLVSTIGGQEVMGKLLDHTFNSDSKVTLEQILGSDAWKQVEAKFKLSSQAGEFVEQYRGSFDETKLKEYEAKVKQSSSLKKKQYKLQEEMIAAGDSIILPDDPEQMNARQKALATITKQIGLLDAQADAMRTVANEEAATNNGLAKKLELIDQQVKLTNELNNAEQETKKIQEEQKLAYETVNQSLKDYTGYAQQMIQLENKMKKATGANRVLLSSQMEMLRGYADESLEGLTPEIIGKMSPEQKRKMLVTAERNKKQLDLAMAGGGAGEKPGLFAQFSSGLKSGLGRMYGFGMLGYKLANYLGATVKKIMGYAAQLDQAMVNIQIVTGKTRDGAYSLIDGYNDLAKQLGSTTSEIANSANVWLRQGYSVNKVNELITSSLYLSKLGMLDTGTAAKDLTGIIKGFKLEVSDATDVVSKLTMIDQNAAVSAGNIATAMQQVSASAQQAGLDIDTTMGYISTIADVSQRDPSSVGSSLRTIISRYGTVKAGAFAGMGIDNTTDDLENVNDIEKVLRRLGITIRTSTMEFRGLDDVLGEVAGKWNEWSSVERNAVATAFAGTRQRESFLILMSNYEKAKELTRVAAESQGAAEIKYQAYMESAEAATKRVQNAWEGLTTSLRSSDFLKGIKNTVAWLVENLDKILTTLTSIWAGLKAARVANIIRNTGGLSAFFSGTFGKYGSIKSGLNASTEKEILEAQKTAGGRFGLKLKNAKGWYTGEDKSTTDFYLPKFNKKLGEIIQLLKEQKPKATGSTTPKTKGETTTSEGQTDTTADTGTKDTGTTTQAGTNAKGYKVSKKVKVRKKLVSKQKTVNTSAVSVPTIQSSTHYTGSGRSYKSYIVNGHEYFQARDGWHDTANPGRAISNQEARNLGLVNLPSQFQQQQAQTPAAAVRVRKPAAVRNASSLRVVPPATDTAKEVVPPATDTADGGQKRGPIKRFTSWARAHKAKDSNSIAAGASIVGGVVSGVTQGIGTGMSFKDSDGGEASTEAKTAAGVISGGTTAVLSTGLAAAGAYFGGPMGAMLGQTLGSTLGGILGPLLGNAIGNAIDKSALDRRERSKEASELLSAVKSIKSDTTEMRDLANSGNWSFDTYQKASSTATSVMNRLYSDPKLALQLYSAFGENTENLSEGEALKRMESIINSEFLNGTMQQRKDFMATYENALAQAERTSTYGSTEDERYLRKQSILDNAWGVTGALGNESGIVKDFIKNKPDAASRSGGKLYFYGGLSTRISNAKRLRSLLEAAGYKNTDLYKNLTTYIADMQEAETQDTKFAKEMTGLTVSASVTAQNYSQYSRQAIKNMGKDQIFQEILNGINEQGGFYEYDSMGNERRTKYSWTGSIDTMPEAVRNELLQAVNNDELLGSIFANNKGYTLKEIFDNSTTISDENRQQYKLSFAQALGLSVEQLADQAERLGDFTLGELTKGYEDTKKDIEELASLMDSMASSSGVTANNLTTIISQFPSLLPYINDTATMAEQLFVQLNVRIDRLQRNLVEQVLENESFFTNWVEQLPEELQKVLTDGEFFDLKKLTSGSTFWEAYLSLSPEAKLKIGAVYDEIGEAFKAVYNNISLDAAITTSDLDKVSSYYSKVYDLQIKNLESQKTALQQITSQREYENKLIDARNKLENAQNEKRAVYREGVGIVYEADQEAVQQAQKELDELDNQKQISELETQIIELQSQKAWLDQRGERAEFQNLESTTGGILAALGTDKNQGIWGTVNALLEAYKIKNNITTSGSTDLLAEARSAKITSAKQSLSTEYDTYSEVMALVNAAQAYWNGEITQSEFDKVLSTGKSSSNDVVKAVYTDFETNMTEQGLNAAYEHANDAAEAIYGRGYTAVSTLKDLGALGRDTLHMRQAFGGNQYQRQELQSNLDMRKFRKNQWNWTQGHGFFLDESDLSGDLMESPTNKMPFLFAVLGYEHGDHEGSLPTIRETIKSHLMDNGMTLSDPALDQAITAAIEDWENDSDVLGAIGDIFARSMTTPGGIATVLVNPDTYTDRFERSARHLAYEIFRHIGNSPELHALAVQSNLLGSMHTAGGLSLISEKGPELLATPGLTGAALIPEGSKVLPHNAVAGLWALGEMVSQYIRPLASMSGGMAASTSNVFGSTDESTNINTLNMTINADSGFNVQGFVDALKQLNAVTNHTK